MSFFNNITKFFNNEKYNKVLGVDIGSASIKIVQLSLKKGIVVLDTFGEISLSVYAGKEIGRSVVLDESKTTEALRDLMKEAQVDAKIAAFAIPLKSALMFNLKLTKNIEREKLDKIIRIEAIKYVPVPIEEVQLDWSIIPSINRDKDKDYYNILVVAIHRETLNKYSNIALANNLDLKFLEVETFSTIRSIIKHERNTIAIIDIGPSMTKFYIVDSGIIRKSHIINVGFSKILGAHRRSNDKSVSQFTEINNEAINSLNKTMDNTEDIPVDMVRIINQVRKAMLDYQKKNNQNIPNVVFTGGGAIIKKMSSYITNQLGVSIMDADPFSKISNPAFLDEPLKETGAEFAVSLGVALRGLRK